ncbi:hypothetical protein DSL92_07110 [Billgrantia gudaonensis]|uniref:Uncharacterized protein n=1 Tax=Billgrantia gudaonensis TaxID=376427 RepID=A0A3S0QFQ6_9GAMM|nr:hypothetical protein DSL92_07110 [Halomonas gudaonensis]
MEVRCAQYAVAASRHATGLSLRGMFRQHRVVAVAKSRYRLVLDPRRRMASLEAIFERWLSPDNFDAEAGGGVFRCRP